MQCTDVINTLSACLKASGANPGLADFISLLLGVVLVMSFPLILVILLIWVERKFAARVQDRLGPNRVGPYGLLQNIADAIKLITKEDITPVGADRFIYNVSPILMVMSVLAIWAVIPFSPIHIGVDLETGALYFVAVASFSTLAVMIGGWASNNKYALLGAFRVVAQLISYEVPLVFSLLVPVMLAGTMQMGKIVEAQTGMWFMFMVPLSAFLFFTSGQAEAGRAPFDLLEAESELVAGFNIEYSGMKFGLFMAGEFIHVFTNGMLMAVLFTGGWLGPWAREVPFLGFVWLMVKTSIWYAISLLIRNTVPRVRIDQMMSFNWKFLVPASIVNLLVISFLLKLMQQLGIAPTLDANTSFVSTLPMTIILLLANLGMSAVLLNLVRNVGKRERERLAEDRSRAIELVEQGHEIEPVAHAAAGH
jgi:NADH-quinone oxidoreductase subunit H